MTMGIEKNHRCEICGTVIYNAIEGDKNFRKTEEGYVHLDCLEREKAQQKSNENIEQGVMYATA